MQWGPDQRLSRVMEILAAAILLHTAVWPMKDLCGKDRMSHLILDERLPKDLEKDFKEVGTHPKDIITQTQTPSCLIMETKLFEKAVVKGFPLIHILEVNRVDRCLLNLLHLFEEGISETIQMGLLHSGEALEGGEGFLGAEAAEVDVDVEGMTR